MAHIDRAFRSNIKLRHLQLLVALDEFRHLGRTAEFLSVSQPAISKVLAEVEKMLGMTLFTRSTRGTEPTPAGESLVRFARSVLAQYDVTRDEIEAVASGAAGRVRVGSMGAALPVLLANAVARVKQRSPRATVLIEEGDLTHLLPRLRLSELDVVVGRLEPAYAAPDLVTEALYDEPMVAIVAAGHPLSRKRRVDWGDLSRHPLVLPPPWASLRVKIEQAFVRHGQDLPADLIESSSYFAVTTFVAQRQAVGFVARSVGQQMQAEGRFHVLPMAVEVELPPIGLMTLRDRRPAPGATALIACLHDAARDIARANRPPGKTGRRAHSVV
ncbi:LysR substrate-binding domain-containing protein [Cupriavidus plantarum]|uniref:LysR substrate-binding domain-containing protein n=1 Tax=Cupriavidus plantarum TaxID=942865 RepID=UPI0015CBD559|nr:LysR substrate-binding domain-containing protein [Cupriavidus plantarum]NYI00349.1 DNA-binding transcriptional LysR family regulator [Cupriavidus plantarum]CAG2138094.1 HTH-type transcriptional regulator GbpR [Cupriavidus plantarum]SMR85035.1 DNA-binding transcriptional regulator, LysR family [Cupriavidus plantarum]